MCDKPKILVVSRSFGVYCNEAVEILKAFSLVERRRVSTKEELKSIIKGYDGLVLGNERLDRTVLSEADRLKIVARHGIGIDNIDLEAATERRIVVTYTPGANSDSVAEYTIGLMLNLMRRINKAHEEASKGGWRRFIGFELMGKTVGIVGFGRIGRRVARKLSGFDVKLIVYDPYVNSEEVKRYGAELVSLEHLLKSSDVVTLHVKLTEETRYLINKERLKLMRRGSFLINTSRGAVVDEEALYEALKNGDLAGAALDVFEHEPVSRDNPLLTLDNVIVSPHMANFSVEALRRMDLMNARDLELFFKGERPIHVANPEVLEG
ncbi:phosphoglycerate dehydrogenase [Candidatus Bathyarchaeota archaeon]|nr:phosphoglycerate dehydrogenase [Candidatus Bathyarchaeota archaeon]